ncbi:acetoacetate decarboxylase (plasmid) [Pseudorhodobacter turbinis]|uniref:Acetoacetate decarboxylase n=1 Tax=Pseudorhodobacter turbinis TaxID=2500533 RepID=A0A4P8EKR0_9RHOB|nr:acetoacetate decarboxylase [Pseudorhodobacter turbinis]QCO57820.1 acetoacetate decarboxylase [Pseudorhodobacter turbinis]
MTPTDVLALTAMPPSNPSYPRGPYRFMGREYLIITYESDAQAIRAMVPEPLVPDGSNHVHYEWITMPDSTGFGSCQESGVVIPCLLHGEPVNYTAMMFLNDEPPISAGREIWGFPKRWGEPKLEVRTDTLTGTLHYGGERVGQHQTCKSGQVDKWRNPCPFHHQQSQPDLNPRHERCGYQNGVDHKQNRHHPDLCAGMIIVGQVIGPVNQKMSAIGQRNKKCQPQGTAQKSGAPTRRLRFNSHVIPIGSGQRPRRIKVCLGLRDLSDANSLQTEFGFQTPLWCLRRVCRP